MKKSQFCRAAFMGSLVLSGSIIALGLDTSPNFSIAAGDGGCVRPAALNDTPICSKPAALEMDAALQAALCKALGSPDSHSLLPNDLALLPEVLDLSNQGIKGLDGLEYADKVKCINLAHNQINDLLPLLGMDNLEAVSVAYNELDFQKSLGTLAAAQALKSALVFIDEGVNTQNVKPQAAFKIQNTGTMDVLTITTRAGTGYSLKGEVSKGKWETLVPLIKGTGGDVVHINNHCLAYRLETLSSKYLLQKDPIENPRYVAYLKYMQYEPSATSWNVVSNLYNVTGNNYEGLWFSDARDWYHDRTIYFVDLLSQYNPTSPTKENAADAFRLRASLRAEARLLMGNQVLAKQVLPDRNQTFAEFETYTLGKLEKKNGKTPTDTEIYAEIIQSAQKSNDAWDTQVGWFDSVLEWTREKTGGVVVAPQTKYVPLPAVNIKNN